MARQPAGESCRGGSERAEERAHGVFQLGADLSRGASGRELQRRCGVTSYSGAVRRSSAGKPAGRGNGGDEARNG